MGVSASGRQSGFHPENGSSILPTPTMNKSELYNIIASHVCPIWGQDTCQCGAKCGECLWLDKFVKNIA